jgi:tetratricopeptide (TPR) repeat protein
MQLNDNQKSAIALTELDYFFDKYKMMDELKGLFRLSGSLTPEEIDQIVLQKKHRFAELSTHTIIVYGTWLAKQNRDYLYKAGAEGNKKRYNYLHSEAKYPKETSDFPGKKEILILLNELSSPYQYYNTKMLLEMAQQELANKNFTDGVIPISKAILSRDSVNTSAWYYLGMSYQNSAKPNEALAALDKAIQYDSSNIEALHEKYKIISNASLSKENYEKLIPLSKVLKNACLTNKSHRIADLYKEVLSTICKIELYGLENQEFYNLYKSASGKVAADAAAEFFKLIPAIKTNSSEISYAGILWNTAEKYKFVAEYKKDSLAALLSDSLCSELIRMGYKFPTAFSTRIDIQLSLPHRETACLEIIKEAKVIFPEDSSLIDAEGKVYFRLGSKCFKQKQYAECVDWLNKYVVSRKTPAPIAYQMLGYSLLHTRDYKNSIHYFQLLEQYFKGDKEELTAYFPNFYDVINYAKAPSNAVPEMKSNIEGIENEKQKMNEAINLVKQKKHYDAITILNSSDIYFTSIQSKKNRKAVNKQIGRINYLLENYEEALIKFQFALSLDSADGEIYKLISLTFQEQADLLNSEKIISKGLKVLPDDIHLAEASAFHWAANGDFAYKIKAFDVAAQCFSKSLEWSPEFAVAHLYLGLSLANINPEDRSYIKHLKKGLDLSPELEKDVPEIRQLIDGTFFTYFQTESADYSDPLEACKCTYVLNAAKDGKCMTVVRIQNTEWYYVLPCNNRTITPTDIVNLGTAACLTGQMREKGFRLW